MPSLNINPNSSVPSPLTIARTGMQASFSNDTPSGTFLTCTDTQISVSYILFKVNINQRVHETNRKKRKLTKPFSLAFSSAFFKDSKSKFKVNYLFSPPIAPGFA